MCVSGMLLSGKLVKVLLKCINGDVLASKLYFFILQCLPLWITQQFSQLFLIYYTLTFFADSLQIVMVVAKYFECNNILTQDWGILY